MVFAISQLQPSGIVATIGSRSRPRPSRATFIRSSKSQPSISEIERAIGIASDPANSPLDINTSLMDLLESTPIGREGPTERALREAAEKFTDHAEAHTASGIED